MYLHGFENIWKIKTRQGEWTLSIPNLKDLKSENEVLNSSRIGDRYAHIYWVSMSLAEFVEGRAIKDVPW